MKNKTFLKLKENLKFFFKLMIMPFIITTLLISINIKKRDLDLKTPQTQKSKPLKRVKRSKKEELKKQGWKEIWIGGYLFFEKDFGYSKKLQRWGKISEKFGSQKYTVKNYRLIKVFNKLFVEITHSDNDIKVWYYNKNKLTSWLGVKNYIKKVSINKKWWIVNQQNKIIFSDDKKVENLNTFNINNKIKQTKFKNIQWSKKHYFLNHQKHYAYKGAGWLNFPIPGYHGEFQNYIFKDWELDLKSGIAWSIWQQMYAKKAYSPLNYSINDKNKISFGKYRYNLIYDYLIRIFYINHNIWVEFKKKEYGSNHEHKEGIFRLTNFTTVSPYEYKLFSYHNIRELVLNRSNKWNTISLNWDPQTIKWFVFNNKIYYYQNNLITKKEGQFNTSNTQGEYKFWGLHTPKFKIFKLDNKEYIIVNGKINTWNGLNSTPTIKPHPDLWTIYDTSWEPVLSWNSTENNTQTFKSWNQLVFPKLELLHKFIPHFTDNQLGKLIDRYNLNNSKLIQSLTLRQKYIFLSSFTQDHFTYLIKTHLNFLKQFFILSDEESWRNINTIEKLDDDKFLITYTSHTQSTPNRKVVKLDINNKHLSQYQLLFSLYSKQEKYKDLYKNFNIYFKTQNLFLKEVGDEIWIYGLHTFNLFSENINQEENWLFKLKKNTLRHYFYKDKNKPKIYFIEITKEQDYIDNKHYINYYVINESKITLLSIKNKFFLEGGEFLQTSNFQTIKWRTQTTIPKKLIKNKYLYKDYFLTKNTDDDTYDIYKLDSSGLSQIKDNIILVNFTPNLSIKEKELNTFIFKKIVQDSNGNNITRYYILNKYVKSPIFLEFYKLNEKKELVKSKETFNESEILSIFYNQLSKTFIIKYKDKTLRIFKIEYNKSLKKWIIKDKTHKFKEDNMWKNGGKIPKPNTNDSKLKEINLSQNNILTITYEDETILYFNPNTLKQIESKYVILKWVHNTPYFLVYEIDENDDKNILRERKKILSKLSFFQEEIKPLKLMELSTDPKSKTQLIESSKYPTTLSKQDKKSTTPKPNFKISLVGPTIFKVYNPKNKQTIYHSIFDISRDILYNNDIVYDLEIGFYIEYYYIKVYMSKYVLVNQNKEINGVKTQPWNFNFYQKTKQGDIIFYDSIAEIKNKLLNKFFLNSFNSFKDNIDFLYDFFKDLTDQTTFYQKILTNFKKIQKEFKEFKEKLKTIPNSNIILEKYKFIFEEVENLKTQLKNPNLLTYIKSQEEYLKNIKTLENLKKEKKPLSKHYTILVVEKRSVSEKEFKKEKELNELRNKIIKIDLQITKIKEKINLFQTNYNIEQQKKYEIELKHYKSLLHNFFYKLHIKDKGLYTKTKTQLFSHILYYIFLKENDFLKPNHLSFPFYPFHIFNSMYSLMKNEPTQKYKKFQSTLYIFYVYSFIRDYYNKPLNDKFKNSGKEKYPLIQIEELFLKLTKPNQTKHTKKESSIEDRIKELPKSISKTIPKNSIPKILEMLKKPGNENKLPFAILTTQQILNFYFNQYNTKKYKLKKQYLTSRIYIIGKILARLKTFSNKSPFEKLRPYLNWYTENDTFKIHSSYLLRPYLDIQIKKTRDELLNELKLFINKSDEKPFSQKVQLQKTYIQFKDFYLKIRTQYLKYESDKVVLEDGYGDLGFWQIGKKINKAVSTFFKNLIVWLCVAPVVVIIFTRKLLMGGFLQKSITNIFSQTESIPISIPLYDKPIMVSLGWIILISVVILSLITITILSYVYKYFFSHKAIQFRDFIQNKLLFYTIIALSPLLTFFAFILLFYLLGVFETEISKLLFGEKQNIDQIFKSSTFHGGWLTEDAEQQEWVKEQKFNIKTMYNIDLYIYNFNIIYFFANYIPSVLFIGAMYITYISLTFKLYIYLITSLLMLFNSKDKPEFHFYEYRKKIREYILSFFILSFFLIIWLLMKKAMTLALNQLLSTELKGTPFIVVILAQSVILYIFSKKVLTIKADMIYKLTGVLPPTQNPNSIFNKVKSNTKSYMTAGLSKLTSKFKRK